MGRKIFAIDTPGVEGSTHPWLPKSDCKHSFKAIPHIPKFGKCKHCGIVRAKRNR